ncbi:RNase adapter RapZ [Bermanella marisrubri]|uniref:Predicted P-loop-containing kinase n=1 Tax=Bermanella marisrubri TaxID=207949 RepID=Q1MYM4_9GAMM|nr:RNase adapter RapZ [Bermanella marisrubri]EAT11092.1 predicted P-loop-containing kinase [Oceanobacter sp. RED65] [Bermanella marisrubri]QIZ83407.1 RNase adapter RapZ [Bermanella marisrubri]
MKLVIISGRSGSGKSTALNVLEDLGFYCIDNLPVMLLPTLMQQANQQGTGLVGMAVSIDARNIRSELGNFADIVSQLPNDCILEIIYLDAHVDTLLTRFSATRRKHPLTDADVPLFEAINKEVELLHHIADMADLTIDTTHLSMHQLRTMIKNRVVDKDSNEMSILFESFGFKHGIPKDSDLVFDVRCLPNPYWDPQLRHFTGQDQAIIDFLSDESSVNEMYSDIDDYLQKWLPEFQNNNRTYMTISIGCTGGQHRSVYMTERLYQAYEKRYQNVQLRHRELNP